MRRNQPTPMQRILTVALPKMCCLFVFLTFPVPEAFAWRWDEVATTGPSGRVSFSMAFVESTGNILFFGGFDGNQVKDDTWEWDGSQWKQLNISGPSARRNHAMTYDSDRDKVVLFGGTTGGDYLSDVWEWDPTTRQWSHVDEFTLEPRTDMGFAYDPISKKTVLFGGRRGEQYFNTTWLWDGNSWTQLQTGGPSARDFCTMIYVPGPDRIYLFGGREHGNHYGDTWEWDGTIQQWTKLADTGPEPRRGHRLSFNPECGMLLLMGGDNDARRFGDVWEWDLQNGGWTPARVSGFSHFAYHEQVYYPPENVTFLFGGWTDPGTNASTWFLENPPAGVTISVNQPEFYRLQTMEVTLDTYNPSCLDEDVDIYVVFEIMGLYFFHPAYDLNPAPMDSKLMTRDYQNSEIVLTFQFPKRFNDPIDFVWYAAAMGRTTGNLVGEVSIAQAQYVPRVTR